MFRGFGWKVKILLYILMAITAIIIFNVIRQLPSMKIVLAMKDVSAYAFYTFWLFGILTIYTVFRLVIGFITQSFVGTKAKYEQLSNQKGDG